METPFMRHTTVANMQPVQIYRQAEAFLVRATRDIAEMVWFALQKWNALLLLILQKMVLTGNFTVCTGMLVEFQVHARAQTVTQVTQVPTVRLISTSVLRQKTQTIRNYVLLKTRIFVVSL